MKRRVLLKLHYYYELKKVRSELKERMKERESEKQSVICNVVMMMRMRKKEDRFRF